MIYRYQPLYEDPEYYGDEEQELYQDDEELEEEEQTDLERPLYVGLRSDREMEQILG